MPTRPQHDSVACAGLIGNNDPSVNRQLAGNDGRRKQQLARAGLPGQLLTWTRQSRGSLRACRRINEWKELFRGAPVDAVGFPSASTQYQQRQLRARRQHEPRFGALRSS